jgi:hypothetical protein
VTGPNPDAALDAALGIAELPPAVVTHEHLARAKELCRAMVPGNYPAPWMVEVAAQALADEGKRVLARFIAEHQVAGTPVIEEVFE